MTTTKKDEQDERDAVHARSANAQTTDSAKDAAAAERPTKDVAHMTPQERAKARAFYGKDERLTEWACQTMGGSDQAITDALNALVSNRWHIYQFVNLEPSNGVRVFARRPLLTIEEVADLKLIEEADQRDVEAERAKKQAVAAAAAKKLAAENAAKAAEDAKKKADEEAKLADEAVKKTAADAKKAGAPADEKAPAATR